MLHDSMYYKAYVMWHDSMYYIAYVMSYDSMYDKNIRDLIWLIVSQSIHIRDVICNGLMYDKARVMKSNTTTTIYGY